MRFPTGLARRLRWINLPGAALLALLQRTPVVRVAAVAEEFVHASPIGALLRSAAATVAALGAVHSLAGATTISVSSGTPAGVSVTVGTPMTTVAYGMIGTLAQPMSWQITGTVPPGLRFLGSSGPALTAAGILNTPTGVMFLTGTPTSAGTFNLTLQSFQFPNAAPTTSDIFSYTITVAPAATAAPQIVTQPTTQSVNAGATVVFRVEATGSPAPTFQWRKDGATIAGATGATLTLSSVQTASARPV